MKVTLQNLTKKFPGRGKKNRQDVIAVNDFTFEMATFSFINFKFHFTKTEKAYLRQGIFVGIVALP